MVSSLQRIAASATDARCGPGAARFATGPELRRRADRRLAAPLMPAASAVALVMWNMRKRHFSHSCQPAVARTALKGARSVRAAKRACPLTATAAGATRVSAPVMPVPPRSFAFNRFTPQQPWLLPQEPRTGRFALSCLIPLTLTYVNA